MHSKVILEHLCIRFNFFWDQNKFQITLFSKSNKWWYLGCGKKRSDPTFTASDPVAAEALAEVLANDIATGDVDDWEQYMLKGIEMVDGGAAQQQLGIVRDDYLRKKREATDNAEAE